MVPGVPELLGFETYYRVKTGHNKWVESCLENGDNFRDDKWTQEHRRRQRTIYWKLKSSMGAMAAGRKSIEAEDSYQLREAQSPYIKKESEQSNRQQQEIAALRTTIGGHLFFGSRVWLWQFWEKHWKN